MMTLTLSPELEQKIASQANARGVPVGEYAAEILDRTLTELEAAPQPISVSHASAEEMLSGLREMAKTATPISNYPSDFFSREVIYADHD
jgi:hypothetical protein